EMEEQDALDLASYLLDIPGSYGEVAPKLEPFVPDPPRAQRGEQVTAALRCAACHDLPAAVAVTEIPIHRFEGGCLAEKPSAPGVPHYPLGRGQREALQAYLSERNQPL